MGRVKSAVSFIWYIGRGLSDGRELNADSNSHQNQGLKMYSLRDIKSNVCIITVTNVSILYYDRILSKPDYIKVEAKGEECHNVY